MSIFTFSSPNIDIGQTSGRSPGRRVEVRWGQAKRKDEEPSNLAFFRGEDVQGIYPKDPWDWYITFGWFLW